MQYIRFKVNASTAGASCSTAELGFFEYEDGVMESGDTTLLAALTDSLAALNEADYSSASWAKLAAAKAKAEEILTAEGMIPQTMADNAYTALAAAKKQLVSILPADEMRAQYAALKQADYTEESWAAFTAAMADVDIDARLNAATADRQVTDVIIKVNYEMSKLVKVPENPEEKVYTAYVDGKAYAEGCYNTRVELHAEKENFVCWMAGADAENMKPVSVNPDYTFYLANDVYLTAVYEEMTIDPSASLVNTIAMPAKDGKINARFVAQLTVPE